MPPSAQPHLLAGLSSHYIGSGMAELPDPMDSVRETYPVVMDVPHVGRVLVVYHRVVNRRARTYFWLASSADLLADLEPIEIPPDEGPPASMYRR